MRCAGVRLIHSPTDSSLHQIRDVPAITLAPLRLWR
jgi:hypothetical protein